MPLFAAQQKISFLSRPGPPKVISFKSWAVFKHRWPLKIKGQHVNSPQPRSQILPLLEMKGIFKKTSCAWSCLHFCPTGLFGQGCQRLSERADHKTKMCCPAAGWSCCFALAPVRRWALYSTRGARGDAQVPRRFLIPVWLGGCCHAGSEGRPGRHSRGPPPRDAQLLQQQPQGDGGMERRGPWAACRPLCPHRGAPGKRPHMRGAGDGGGHGLGAKRLVSSLPLPHPDTGPRGWQRQN